MSLSSPYTIRFLFLKVKIYQTSKDVMTVVRACRIPFEQFLAEAGAKNEYTWSRWNSAVETRLSEPRLSEFGEENNRPTATKETTLPTIDSDPDECLQKSCQLPLNGSRHYRSRPEVAVVVKGLLDNDVALFVKRMRSDNGTRFELTASTANAIEPSVTFIIR
ncbi:hypothetical protein M513_11967 [Trichuris suis]|uniref:Uncharacterized protein n=1 Tax=Trichuris suis TaxID=68888 RepID=A0A085LQB2_9BILA|nr:hypothetical protein M513_11967 [Trichuris suis]